MARDEALTARNSAFEQVRQLIASGQDLNKSDAYGTPLHQAALNGYEVIVEKTNSNTVRRVEVSLTWDSSQ